MATASTTGIVALSTGTVAVVTVWREEKDAFVCLFSLLSLFRRVLENSASSKLLTEDWYCTIVVRNPSDKSNKLVVGIEDNTSIDPIDSTDLWKATLVVVGVFLVALDHRHDRRASDDYSRYLTSPRVRSVFHKYFFPKDINVNCANESEREAFLHLPIENDLIDRHSKGFGGIFLHIPNTEIIIAFDNEGLPIGSVGCFDFDHFAILTTSHFLVEKRKISSIQRVSLPHRAKAAEAQRS